MPFHIHPVETEEAILSVADLAHTIWHSHYTQIIGQAQVNYMLSQFQSPEAIEEQLKQGRHYALISRESTCLGYAAYETPSPAILHLSKLYVLPEARGKGVGKALLKHAEQEADRQGCEWINLTVNRHNASAIEWYERQGFRIRQAVKKPIGDGFYMDDWEMEKPLSSL